MNELAVRDEQQDELAVIEKNLAICNQLLTLPHYKKIGAEGILSVLMVADALGVDKRLALNGALYMAKSGCIEMKAATMAMLIRKKGHLVTKDERSNNQICILHGKRADNGNEWTCSYSVEDATQAGLLGNYENAWKKYTQDMLYNRALSRLARQLFSDVIGNCYVEGEISQAPGLAEKVTRRGKEEESLIETIEEFESLDEKVPQGKPMSKYDIMTLELWELMRNKKTELPSNPPLEMPFYMEYLQNFMKNTDIRTLFNDWSSMYSRFVIGMDKWYQAEGQYIYASHLDPKEAD
jgi:hypothetical protein